MTTLTDIKEDIVLLRDRINKSQEFRIPVRYIDNGEEKHESLNISDFAQKWQELATRRLWRLHYDIGSSYLITHSLKAKELENDIEKLMLAIGKLEAYMSRTLSGPIEKVRDIAKGKKSVIDVKPEKRHEEPEESEEGGGQE